MDKYCIIQKGSINMKKYLSLLLALCLALALLALPGRAAAADLSLTLSFQPRGSPAVGAELDPPAIRQPTCSKPASQNPTLQRLVRQTTIRPS